MKVGQHIRQARELANMTQAELGEKIGVSGVAIMRYEKGTRQPRIEQLQAIADALNVSPFYLLGDEKATMCANDIKASIGLEDYLKSLGYEFVTDYERGGKEYELCIDRTQKKLYLLSPDKVSQFEYAVRTYTNFSIAELLESGEEIDDDDGWFDQHNTRQTDVKK